MITFKNHRLRIGYRRENWHDVWYQPAEGEPDEHGYVEMLLFNSPRGGPTTNDPMEGEVVWLANFDVANCESKSKPERERKQKIELYKAWKYCDETNQEQAFQLEEELDRPDCRRWQSWFTHAKKWKRSQLQGRKRKRAERIQSEAVQAVLGSGVDVSELGELSDSEDSAYGSEAEREMAEERRKRGRPMPPPRRPAGPEPARNHATNDRKKAKPAGNAARKGRGKQKQIENPPSMSGGLGHRGTSTAPQNDGRAFLMGDLDSGQSSNGKANMRNQAIVEEISDDDDNRNDRGHSLPWDASPPEEPSLFDLTTRPSEGHIGCARFASQAAARDYNGITGYGARIRDQSSSDPQEPTIRAFDALGANAGLSEEAAYRQAITASMPPEDAARMRHELRQSLEREQPPDHIQQSVETDQHVEDLIADQDEPQGAAADPDESQEATDDPDEP